MIISVTKLYADPEYLRIKSRDHLINNVRGTLKIESKPDDCSLFASDFYVVEFVEKLSAWLSTNGEEFKFESMNDERENLIVFTRSSAAWEIETHDCWAIWNGQFIYSDEELKIACKSFIEEFKNQINRKFDIHIWEYCDIK